MQHLYVDRVDFCTFGNSTPFRIRIVNAYNDNQDYFYVKKADASRVYGLELEHLLSPNRLNFLTSGSTLIEEHIPGIPGDIFIKRWLQRGDLRPIRVAKELVKFNERCFVRLLGDMRSYNFVFVVTPDFEDAQLRIRAMDFDQQILQRPEELLPAAVLQGKHRRWRSSARSTCTRRPPTSTSARSRRSCSSAPPLPPTGSAGCCTRWRRIPSPRGKTCTSSARASPSTTAGAEYLALRVHGRRSSARTSSRSAAASDARRPARRPSAR